MAKAAALPWITAALGLGSGIDTRQKGRTAANTAEDAALRAEETATATAQATKDELADVENKANLKKKKRASELATGGRAAQFKTGPLGLRNQAAVGRKTLLGA